MTRALEGRRVDPESINSGSEDGMAGYVISQILAVKDPASLSDYRSKVGETIQQYGGKFIVRGGAVQALEGRWEPRMVVIEFESPVRAREWYDSAEYRPLRDLRQHSADTQLIIIEGI
jgi:uncharacterized protein (DUF1330 family)